MDDKQFEKLPKWAQAEINNLKRERETAIRALNRYVDNQTQSEIYIEENESTGEQRGPSRKTRYIQGHRIEFKHAGVSLSVSVYRDGQIELQWGGGDIHGNEVAFIPTSYQAARLVAKENMR